jgi:hypothetical protein
MFDFSRDVVDKILNKRVPRVEDPSCTSDNTRKGDENVPNMRTKEDLFNI